MSSLALYLCSALLTLIWIGFLLSKHGLAMFADIPNARSMHQKPVPRGAGFAFALVSALAFATARPDIPYGGVLSAAFLMTGVTGIVDDKKGLSSRFRLLLQAFAGVLVFYAVFATRFQAMSGSSLWVLGALSVFFTVAAINFYNFMDGINGLVGLSAILVLGFGQFILRPEQFSGILVACLGISLLIFLVFNLVLRKVFMGDAGSTVLGLVHAYIFTLVLSSGTAGQSSLSGDLFQALLLTYLLSVALNFWFFFDCASMVVAKKLLKLPFSLPHRQHQYQVLARKRGSHFITSAMVVLAQFVFFATYVVLEQTTRFVPFIVGALVCYGCVFGIFLMLNLKSAKTIQRT